MENYYNEKQFVSDLSGLIEIKSVKGNCGDVTEKYPLGEGIGHALEYTAAVAEKYGLKTVNLDNKCCYVEAGKGERLIGVLVHADTVDVDSQWTYEPFKLTETEDKIYGRGVSDNKGAVILMIHVLKYLSDNGFLNDKRVRLIVGGDEENGGWDGMK